MDRLLEEQVAYYRALAEEYDDHALPFGGGDKLSAALDAFGPAGTLLLRAGNPVQVSTCSARGRTRAVSGDGAIRSPSP